MQVRWSSSWGGHKPLTKQEKHGELTCGAIAIHGTHEGSSWEPADRRLLESSQVDHRLLESSGADRKRLTQ